jgi:hypothetical protein
VLGPLELRLVADDDEVDVVLATEAVVGHRPLERFQCVDPLLRARMGGKQPSPTAAASDAVAVSPVREVPNQRPRAALLPRGFRRLMKPDGRRAQ